MLQKVKMDAKVSRPDPDPTTLTTDALIREIAHLQKLTDEKFNGRDLALGIALQAAKEAAGKSEAAIGKQVDLLKEQLDDYRNRLYTIEGRSTGHSQSWGVIVAASGILIALLTLALRFVK